MNKTKCVKYEHEQDKMSVLNHVRRIFSNMSDFYVKMFNIVII
jgi:hypothetical protein